MAVSQFAPTCFGQDVSKRLDAFLSQGNLQGAEQYFKSVIQNNQGNHSEKSALGIVQFLQAIEQLGQSNFRYALIGRHARQFPIARLPIPVNESPEKANYAAIRRIIEQLEERLAIAQSTLESVDTTNVEIDLFLGRAKLDLNGDGKFAENETAWKIFASVNNALNAVQGESFSVHVDGADIHWLNGYCHVLMFLCDVILAHDEHELFDRCAQLWFANVDSPFAKSIQPESSQTLYDYQNIVDVIAAIHLIRFPIVDRNRMASAHQHLLQMITQSRKCWKRALEEKDNDREWIPNPSQSSVMLLRVTAEMITSWHGVLDEIEAIVNGTKLAPYWRKYNRFITERSVIPETGIGINLKKFFLEPVDFDLVLILQGSNLEPYLENGPLSTPEAWSRLTRVFQGEFFGFAIWFN